MMAGAPGWDRFAQSMTLAVVIPAYEAARLVGAVVTSLRQALAERGESLPILVVDDGSEDDTAGVAEGAGAHVVRHATNQGKGAALTTGLLWARARGHETIVTADADGQHPTPSILRVLDAPAPPSHLVLGVRDLLGDGAPTAHRFSNGLSNRFLSWFTGQSLRDTQCGLRRYPVTETLKLEVKSPGYAFEAEVLLRAARAGIPILQVPTPVLYPPEGERLSHFHVVRDPARIVVTVLRTVLEP
jgi:glycosyltransferase involved in cell wall biosynthesis